MNAIELAVETAKAQWRYDKAMLPVKKILEERGGRLESIAETQRHLDALKSFRRTCAVEIEK